MDSAIVRSFPNAFPLTTGGSLWHNKQSTKKICYANCYASKVLEHKRKKEIEHEFWRLRKPTLYDDYKCIGGGSTFQGCNRKYDVKMTLKPSFDSGNHASDAKNILDSAKYFLFAYYKLSLPVTTIIRTLSMISASLIAVEKLSDISPRFFIGLLQITLPNLFMDIYVNGLNQLCDLGIDKINKPYRPLASGEISLSTAVIVVASSLALSFYFGWMIGSWPSIWGLLSCFLLWTAYSIDAPLLRWKKSSLLTAMNQILTWGFVFPIASFFHMQTYVFKKPAIFPRPLIFVVAIISFYYWGMAVFKDIPDVEGDKAFGINTIPARIGLKPAFWISISLMEMAFGVALLAGAASSSCLWIKIVTGLGHVLLASIIWYKAKSIDLKSNASIASFYIFLWKLIGVEHFLMAFIR